MAGTVVVESLYYRDQFDDWIAGGRLEIESRTCFWSASDSGYGHGWEIEPVPVERDWPGLTEEHAEAGMAAIEHALRTHRCEYPA